MKYQVFNLFINYIALVIISIIVALLIFLSIKLAKEYDSSDKSAPSSRSSVESFEPTVCGRNVSELRTVRNECEPRRKSFRIDNESEDADSN